MKLGLRLVTGRPHKDDHVDQHTGRTVTIIVHGSDTYQLDGDVNAAVTRMTPPSQAGRAHHLLANDNLDPDAHLSRGFADRRRDACL